MPDKSALGAKMKDRERVTRTVLPRRTWTILRLDGRAFHTYTRGLERPFDAQFASDMDATAAAVAKDVMGTRFAFVQSDEISLLVTDFSSPTSEQWMGGGVQKIVSLAAARASVALNVRRPAASVESAPVFDARVFTLSSPAEVAEYFIWRQRDCVKNSISMAAQSHFPHKQLQGLHAGQLQEKLFTEAGVNWNNYPDGFKRGRVIQKVASLQEVTYTHKKTGQVNTTTALRTQWVAEAAPHFVQAEDGWLRQAIPCMPQD